MMDGRCTLSYLRTADDLDRPALIPSSPHTMAAEDANATCIDVSVLRAHVPGRNEYSVEGLYLTCVTCPAGGRGIRSSRTIAHRLSPSPRPSVYFTKISHKCSESRLGNKNSTCRRCKSGVPNLWPTCQKLPAEPQKVALDLSKNKKKNIYEKLQKLTVLQDIGLLK